VTDPQRVAAAVADAHRREWAFVLAATARVASDIDLAEECVQDAYLSRARRLACATACRPTRAPG
jgi:RNA polymerase sigma-70 factor (ECF subfamily)